MELAVTLDPSPALWIDDHRIDGAWFAAALAVVIAGVIRWDWRRGSGLPDMKR